MSYIKLLYQSFKISSSLKLILTFVKVFLPRNKINIYSNGASLYKNTN